MWMNQNVINERTEQLYLIHCDIDTPKVLLSASDLVYARHLTT